MVKAILKGTKIHEGYTAKFVYEDGCIKVEDFAHGRSMGYPQVTDINGGRILYKQYIKQGYVLA